MHQGRYVFNFLNKQDDFVYFAPYTDSRLTSTYEKLLHVGGATGHDTSYYLGWISQFITRLECEVKFLNFDKPVAIPFKEYNVSYQDTKLAEVKYGRSYQ